MSNRLAAHGGRCRKPCLKRRSFPASQGLFIEAPQASLPPPLGVHVGGPGNNVPRPGDGRVTQERLLAEERTTKQAATGKAGISARQRAISVEVLATRALPASVSIRVLSQTSNIVSALGCARPRANVGEHASLQIPVQILGA